MNGEWLLCRTSTGKSSSIPARNGLKTLLMFRPECPAMLQGKEDQKKTRAFWSKRRQDMQPVSSGIEIEEAFTIQDSARRDTMYLLKGLPTGVALLSTLLKKSPTTGA